MSELPKGWIGTTVEKIAKLVSGKTPKNVAKFVNHTGSVPWVKVSDMTLPGNEKCISKSVISFSESECKNLGLPIIPEGSVIFPKNGGAIATGKKRQTAKICSIDLNTMALIPMGINKDLLLYWIQTVDLSKLSDGSVVPQMNKSDIAPLYFPLPPLNEQRRIVAKLDRLFAHSRCAREELARVSGLCDRYKQAVLAAACSGDLTADWREGQSSGIVWQSTTLNELIIGKPKNGYSAKPVNYETPFRVLTLTATTSGKFNHEHFKYFDEPISVESEFWLQPNDILVQRGNTIEYVGVSAIYDGSPNKFIYPDLMIRLQPKPSVMVQFLHMALSCEESRKYLRDRATGTAGNMPKINQPTLISLPVALPPIEEQKEIVRRVEKLFKAIDSMMQEYQKASQLCDRLEQATLAKAFRGELVPQDPTDEPAAALLERIQAERQNQPKGKAVKSKQKPRGRSDSSDSEIIGKRENQP
jgi:type I restriction enzyme, S subunit